jgi:hypothetical protein
MAATAGADDIVSPSVPGFRPQVSISLYAAPAPNAFGSPSWSGWVANAETALAAGATSLGDPLTSPSAFYTVSETLPTDFAVTGFASWQGAVSPTGPFASELGQRLHFPWVITGSTGVDDVKLSNVGNLEIYTCTSGVEAATFGDSATYRFGSYSSTRIGIRADGSIVSSGSADQAVNKIIYVGYGQAYDVYHDATGVTTDQQGLGALLAGIGDGMLQYNRGTVTYYDDANSPMASASLTVNMTPEPATMALLALGGAVALVRRVRGRKA